jgi:hypothetical protein
MMAEKKILFQFPHNLSGKKSLQPAGAFKGWTPHSSSWRLGQERSRFPKVKVGQGGMAVAKFDEI